MSEGTDPEVTVEGRGLGSKLARHDEYIDLVPEAERATFEL